MRFGRVLMISMRWCSGRYGLSWHIQSQLVEDVSVFWFYQKNNTAFI